MVSCHPPLFVTDSRRSTAEEFLARKREEKFSGVPAAQSDSFRRSAVGGQFVFSRFTTPAEQTAVHSMKGFSGSNYEGGNLTLEEYSSDTHPSSLHGYSSGVIINWHSTRYDCTVYWRCRCPCVNDELYCPRFKPGMSEEDELKALENTFPLFVLRDAKDPKDRRVEVFNTAREFGIGGDDPAEVYTVP